MLDITLLTRLITLLCLSAACTTPAVADIYVNEDTEFTDEIRISNMHSADTDLVLISEPLSPVENAATIPARATDSLPRELPFAAAVSDAAKAEHLDPALLHAVITAESGHNPNALSPRGAQGLMQLMPITSKRFGLSNPYDPAQNVRAGASYLRELHDLFKGDLALTLAAYNAGPNAVLRHGSRIPPYQETLRYVPRVLNIYRLLSGKSG